MHEAMTAMTAMTQYLVEESTATVGYTQSDEISLAWTDGAPFFDGNAQKMCSTLAAMASVYFNALPIIREPKHGLGWHRSPTFGLRLNGLIRSAMGAVRSSGSSSDDEGRRGDAPRRWR